MKRQILNWASRGQDSDINIYTAALFYVSIQNDQEI